MPKDYFNPENKGLIDSYYPRAIKVDWDTVTGPIDAAFTITISAPDIIGTFMTFIFKVRLFPMIGIRLGSKE